MEIKLHFWSTGMTYYELTQDAIIQIQTTSLTENVGTLGLEYKNTLDIVDLRDCFIISL